MNSSSTRKIAFADTLRGVACMSVVLSHLVLMFVVGPATVTSLTRIDQPTHHAAAVEWFHRWSPIGLGGFGVGLFFIISGFVIPMSIGRLNRVPFAIARFFRIVPTYAASLAFLLAAMWAIRGYFNAPNDIPWLEALASISFIRDLLWIPSIDGIVWTLEIEMHFYALCIILAPMLMRGDTRGLLIWNAAMLAVVLWLGPIPTELSTTHLRLFALLKAFYVAAMFMNLMWIGTIFSFHWHGQCSTRFATFAIVALNVMFVAHLGVNGLLSPRSRVVTLTTYESTLGLFLLAYNRPQWFSGSRFLAFLARISYPLYVVHGVVGYGVEQLLCSLGVNVYLTMGITIALMIGVATVMHHLVEMPTHELGRRLARRVQEWQTPAVDVHLQATPSSTRRAA